MRTLILSDIHLGNRHCQTALLHEVLDRESFKAYLVLHGDRFDPTLSYPMVTEVACLCYQFTTKLNKKVAKWLKKKSKRWGGVLEFVRGRSVAHALDQGVQGVITGHTHFAEDSRIDNVHYVNTGCWTEYPCSYVAIAGGRISLNHPAP